TLVIKDNTALDDNLKLLSEIKVAVNRNSFWDSLNKKVIAISQLYAEILRAHKTKSSFYIQSNYPFSVSHPSTDSVTNTFLAFKEADNNDEELLIDEEFEEEQDDLDNVTIDFLNLETHSAENQAAK
ncbi:8683_t:CDS:2, partial [Scutellospora calospora]